MARTRPTNRGKNSKPARQGSMGPQFMQSPKPGGGAPSKKEAPSAGGKQMNTSMTKPGSGTRGSSRGAR